MRVGIRILRSFLGFSLFALAGNGADAQTAIHLANALGRNVPTVVDGAASGAKIQHVVIVIQERRSFNNLFLGYPGANTANFAIDSKNQRVRITPLSLTAPDFAEDLAADFYGACDGTGSQPGTDCTMHGFDLETQFGLNAAFHYVPHSQTKPLFSIAHQYVLGDSMFASNFDASFVSHQYYIAGQAGNAVDLPSGKWGCDGGRNDYVETLSGRKVHPCFDYVTLADELDAAHLPWRFYAESQSQTGGAWSAYQAIGHIEDGPDWASVISPETNFMLDLARGNLASVTWVTPSYENSDSPGSLSATGPGWVASIVDAVGQSKFWKSTAIFVVWSEWGGWYDPVPPPHEDSDGLGFRVPLLVVSPYAKSGYVSHVQYESGSVLRFAEDAFGLARLSASDSRANSPAADCFDFNQKPRKFKPI